MTTKTPHPDFVLDPEQPIDAELPIEQAPAVMPEPIINPLFQNLVPDTPQTRSLDGKLSFADAMPRLATARCSTSFASPSKPSLVNCAA